MLLQNKFSPEKIEKFKDDWWLIPKKLFDGRSFTDNQALHIQNGKITNILPIDDVANDENVFHTSKLVCPGFFDIQVNGGGGIMFNNDPSVKGLETIFNAHLPFGTTSWLPTLITDSDEKMHQGVDAVISCKGKYGVAGIHLEGPYLNPIKKGTHNLEFIRKMDNTIVELVQKLTKADIPTLITLAPECVPEGSISKLVSHGAKISIGHTNATASQARSGLDEGATCFTHLFNAMPQMLSRDPGVVAEAIESNAYCGIIADGHHVAFQMLSLAIRARTEENKMIVVTDAMSSVGGPDHFNLYGEKIEVNAGKLINKNGDLAGAHIDMISSVQNLISGVGLVAENALSMATKNPAEMMGLSEKIGSISTGCDANLLLLSDDFEISDIIFNGRVC